MDLVKISQEAQKTARMREKRGQLKSDTISILKHCAGEVVEATEAFREIDDAQIRGRASSKQPFADELADIITCALIAAANEGVDIEAALLRVQEKNARRAEQ